MFQVDDEYLNGYARLCGISATGVYLSLCRHTNKDQECWPSVELIGKELAISKWTVFRAIKSLEHWGIITVAREKNKNTKRQEVNVYTLVDKEFWKPKPGSTIAPGAGLQITTKPGSKNDIKPGSTIAPEGNTTREGNTVEGITTTVVEKPRDPINRIFDVFHDTINPQINYGRKPWRDAANDLIVSYGVEEIEKLASVACQIQGREFSPVITNPYQLKEKLASLQIFIKKSQAVPKGAIQRL